MIRVQRPDPPGVLVSRGAACMRRDCKAYEGDPHAYRRGDATLGARSKIYRHDSVKASLLRAQHDKCCYCERKIRASGYGDVEHFRPKGAVRQDEHSAEEKPGYYWLVYEWSNLLISCSVCNTSCKLAFFPLDNPPGRPRPHLAPLSLHRPLLFT